MARAGTTLALCMGIGKLAQGQASVLRAGVPAGSTAEIVAQASAGKQQILRGNPSDLAVIGRQATAPAFVFMRQAKTVACLKQIA